MPFTPISTCLLWEMVAQTTYIYYEELITCHFYHCKNSCNVNVIVRLTRLNAQLHSFQQNANSAVLEWFRRVVCLLPLRTELFLWSGTVFLSFLGVFCFLLDFLCSFSCSFRMVSLLWSRSSINVCQWIPYGVLAGSSSPKPIPNVINGGLHQTGSRDTVAGQLIASKTLPLIPSRYQKCQGVRSQLLVPLVADNPDFDELGLSI